MVADACLTGCTADATAVWKTVLVGSLGAGGKGFYALNVTNPKDAAKDSTDTPEFKVTRSADLVLWEFTNADDVDLGLTFNGAPLNVNSGQARQIAKFENGRWGVVVGNGYNSSSGKAVLYVLFLAGPTGAGSAWQAGGVDYVKIEADAGPDNGLSTPVPFDADGDGLADTAYAGDLQGNVWKFDLSAATTGGWGKSLLFAAGAAQPFTAAPEISLHPDGGTIVFIGSGKYLETTDNATDTPVQTLYGIRDTGATVAKTALNPMVVATITVGSQTFRTTASGCGGASQPDCPANSKGWYINLPTAGERATGSPKLIAGIVFFNTLIPSTSLCDFGGTGWLMALDYLTGGPKNFRVFDTDSNGMINSSDTIVAAVEVGAAVGGTTLIQGGTSSDPGVGVSSLTSGKVASTLIKFGGGSPRRMNWREIIQ